MPENCSTSRTEIVKPLSLDIWDSTQNIILFTILQPSACLPSLQSGYLALCHDVLS